MRDFTTFTGMDMLKIDIANTYGLDKLTFEERIQWCNDHLTVLNYAFVFEAPEYAEFVAQASEPLLFKKAVLALQSAILGLPVGHNVFMDATASGLQIMACLSNCPKTGEATNLIYNGKRNDPYTLVTDEMIRRLPDSPMFEGLTKSEIRALVKKPIMTYFYNSKRQPESVFGKDSVELQVFHEVLNDLFTGAVAVMNIINAEWNPNALYHQWTMPDGHVCHVKVIEQVDTRIEVDELACAHTFAYRFYPNQPSKLGTSLAPNIIHSIDSYIVRQAIERATFELAHIHDAYTSHPNFMTRVMDLYRIILAEIAESDLLQDILSQISGTEIKLKKYDFDLASHIRQSQYALS